MKKKRSLPPPPRCGLEKSVAAQGGVGVLKKIIFWLHHEVRTAMKIPARKQFFRALKGLLHYNGREDDVQHNGRGRWPGSNRQHLYFFLSIEKIKSSILIEANSSLSARESSMGRFWNSIEMRLVITIRSGSPWQASAQKQQA